MTILENIQRQLGRGPEATQPEKKSNVVQGKPAVGQSSDLSRGDFKSFEEVYKTSYSHGLESIYTIETVDLKTVRRIGGPPVKIIPKAAEASCFPLEKVNLQYEFDFGDVFFENMASFVLEEPIQVLGLSKHAEKCLITNGMTNLNDLSNADLNQFIYLKGMGQGHIDEAQQKLNAYLEGHILKQCPFIDFSAWARSVLLFNSNSKKMFVALEPYQLSDLFVLSPAESVEVRMLTHEKRQEWRQEMMFDFLTERSGVVSSIHKVVEVYLKPWMRRRHGLATQQEIMERMQRLADQPVMAERVLEFFGAVYFDGRFALADNLIQRDDHLFFVDATSHKNYLEVIDKAKTYFYKSNLSYSLPELSHLLLREFAKAWISFSECYIEKCLRCSKCFRVRKGDSGLLTVRLA